MKIIVVGGGASGIVASIFAKRNNNEVIVLEKNHDCLKKLLITGNGKCNYFNDDFDIKHYYSDNISLLSNIINENNKRRIIKFIDDIGIVSRVNDGYYYPASDQAYSVHNALIREAINRGVNIINDTEVLNIKKENDSFFIETNNGNYACDKLVISTGSCAFPKTGSTGDGYRFASDFHHQINKVYPGLVQLVSDNKFIKSLSGVRSHVAVSLFSSNEFLKKEVGLIQFTDYGVSGICIYNLSLLVNKLLDHKKQVSVHVNFFNSFNVHSTNDFIELLNNRNSFIIGRSVTELLEGFLNYKIVNLILKMSNIDYNASWNSISDDKKVLLGNYLVDFSINIISTNGFDNAQVCVGGVSLTDINISSFQSKKIPDLYFTGEVVDVTGDCGGYNLGFAFLSGMIVGDSIGDCCD